MRRKPDDPRALSAWARFRRMLNLSELARELEISPVSVFNWRTVPEKRLEAVAQATGIPAARLRPDVNLTRKDTMPWETQD